MITYDKIEKTILKEEGITLKEVQSPTRKREILLTRQIIMYLARKHTDRSLQWIADNWGQTHANIIHCEKVIQNLVDTDLRMRAKIDRYNRLLTLDDRISTVERTISDMSEELVKEMRFLVSQYQTKITNVLNKDL